MNRLESALTDLTNVSLDFYLEDVSTNEFRIHVEEIKTKAACSTDAGKIKAELQKLIDRI